jgi:gluconolactonase
MYAPPPRLSYEVFASVPEALRVGGRTSRWLEINHGGRQMHSFLEGPAFDRAGNLYVVDVAWGRIFRISPAGEFTVAAACDGAPCGLAIPRDGRIFIADRLRGIFCLDPATGALAEVLTSVDGRPFLGINDLTFALNGDLYFTDQGLTGLHDPRGRLYRLRPDGTLQVVVDNIPSPNGLALAPDQQSLLLAVTRDNAVWRVPLDADGTAFKVGVYLRLNGGAGPDGLAMAADGSVAVAHVGNGTVWLFDARGEPVGRLDTDGRFSSNVAFAPGGQDLYVTEAETGRVLRCATGRAGLTLYAHA